MRKVKKKLKKTSVVRTTKRKSNALLDTKNILAHIRSLTTRTHITKRRRLKPTLQKIHPRNKITLQFNPLKKVQPCLKKIQKADSERRKQFFKSKHRGNTSARPVHKQTHKRTC